MTLAPTPPTAPRNNERAGRLLGAFMAIVLLALGVWVVSTGEWHGTSKQGRPVDLYGTAARWMGMVFIALSGFPATLALGRKSRWTVPALACTLVALAVSIVMLVRS